MLICKQCGSSLSENARFCKECGAPVDAEKLVNQPIQRVPMSKQKKRIYAIVGIALVVLFATYKIGELLTSKERLIKRFESALVKNDDEAVADLLTSNDPKLKIDKKSIKGFMKYLDKHPEEVSNIIESLITQSKIFDNTKRQRISADELENDGYPESLVNLEKKGKFLFYDKYELNIDPVYVTISTNYKDTKLYLDDKEIGQADRPNYAKTFGPYLPGIYTLKATLKTDFIDLQEKEEISLVGVGKIAEVNLYLDGQEVAIDSGFEESQDIEGKLLINGKDTGVNPFKEASFGPILTDGSMNFSVEAQLPWGIVKTKEMPIDSEYIVVDLTNDENFQKGIMDLIVKHLKEMLTSYTSGDVNKLTTATQNYKEMLQERIETDKEGGNFYKAKYLETAFDLDSFHLEEEDGNWVLYVDIRSTYLEDTFYEGETPELEEGVYDNELKLVYDSNAKSWLIDDMYASYDFSDENTVVIKEENPPEYVTSWASDASASVNSEE